MRFATSAAVFAAVLTAAASAQAAQIVLAPGDVIGNTGAYSNSPGSTTGAFNATEILDQQTGPVSDSFGATYWINPDNGPADAYITIDLGANYSLTGFDLFNTHNSGFGDRGTGKFTIIGGNSVAADGSNGMKITGPTVTLVDSSLAAAPVSDPISAQSFSSSSAASVRYIAFLPHSVATANSSCCGANNYGLNELRVFGGAPSAVPEPASWAMLILGLFGAGGLLRRRRPAF